MLYLNFVVFPVDTHKSYGTDGRSLNVMRSRLPSLWYLCNSVENCRSSSSFGILFIKYSIFFVHFENWSGLLSLTKCGSGHEFVWVGFVVNGTWNFEKLIC